MHIESLNNYKTAFQLIRILLIVVIIISFSFSFAVFMHYSNKVEKRGEIVYIMDKNTGYTQAAVSSSRDEFRKFQIEAAVKNVYQLWYQFDENSFLKNTEEALYLFGDCGKEMAKVYEDEQILYTLKEKNMKTVVEINDIKIDMSNKIGKIDGVQTFIRNLGQRSRNLKATFSFYDVTPSRENPFGVKIENWDIYDNSEVK